jgi:hypothetical protein
LEITKYLVDILVKYLANIPIKYLADRLPALEETRDIIGLVISSITITIFLKPADPLDNIKHYNILAIYKVNSYINKIKLYSILTIGLDILAKYIYSIFIIIAIYSI